MQQACDKVSRCDRIVNMRLWKVRSCEVIGTYNPLSRLDLSQKRFPVYLADGFSCGGVLHEIALGLHDGPEQEAPVRTNDSNNGVQCVEEVRMLVHVGAGQPG